MRPNPPQLTFCGSSAPLMNGLSLPERVLGGFINHMDSSHAGYEQSMFVKDTAASWAPRMLAGRSFIERLEVTGVEFFESFLSYFAMGRAGKAFQKLFAKLSPVKFTADEMEHLGELSLKEIKELPREFYKKALPVRLATILSAVLGVSIGGEYAFMFVKNLFTVKAFKKSNFDDVVNLKDRSVDEKTNQEIAKKSIRQIIQALGITAGIVGLSAIGVHQQNKLKPILKPVKGLLEKAAHVMDFGNMMTLTKNQFTVFAAIATVAYLKASRDELEHKETIYRLSILLPYLIWGEELLGKALIKAVKGKLHPDLLIKDQLKTKTFKELEKIAREEAPEAAQKLFNKLARQKNLLYFIPNVVGTLAVTLSTAFTARHFTQLRYEKGEAEKAHFMVGKPGQPLLNLPNNSQSRGIESFLAPLMKERQTRLNLSFGLNSAAPGPYGTPMYPGNGSTQNAFAAQPG